MSKLSWKPMTFVAVAIGLMISAFGSGVAAQSSSGEAPVEFDSYWMVFLDRATSPPELSPEASAEVQRGHLAHLGRLWEEGYAVVAGPFAAPPDEKTRGIVLLRGDLSEEEVLQLVSKDPAVEIGRLAPRALKWYCAKGVVSFTSAADWHAARAEAEPEPEAEGKGP